MSAGAIVNNPDTPDQATMDALRKRMIETGDWDRYVYAYLYH
jgi:hypothetical protein